MNEQLFREIENRYRQLKELSDEGKLSPEQFKQDLKRMMIQDEKGRYWMIGGKSGTWYVYENNSWQPSIPYQQKPSMNSEREEPVQEEPQARQEEKQEEEGNAAPKQEEDSVQINVQTEDKYEEKYLEKYGGKYEEKEEEKKEEKYEEAQPRQEEESSWQESKREAEPRIEKIERVEKVERELRKPKKKEEIVSEETKEKTVPCRFCQSQIPVFEVFCHVCGGNQKKDLKSTQPSLSFKEGEMILRSVHVISFLLFFGMIGIVLGVIIGGAFGILNIGGDLIYQFPQMMQDARGKFPGGFLFFGGMGGIAGFIGFAILGAFFALFYNGIAAVFGGIRFKIRS